MKVNYVLCIFVLSSIALCSGYRILAVFPIKGKSHFSVMEQVVKSLAERGHQVDVVSGFPLEKPFPNYTDIIKTPSSKPHETVPYEDLLDRDAVWAAVHRISQEHCELLGLPEFKKIIKNPPKDPPYDLVITQFFIGYQCFTAIGHVWDVPVVGVGTTFIYPHNAHLIGTPLNLGIVSRNLREHKENMTFWDRLYNVVMTHQYMRKFYAKAYMQDAIIKKHLGPSVPSYKELERSVSLILANSHYSFHGVQPKVPALVEIGGIHITDDNSTIEPKLKGLLDESPDGFIFFSFGSLVQIETMPDEVIVKLFNVFKKVSPVRIIMKFPSPHLLKIKLPENVFTFPWVPQRKILQHPKIRAFVTHGGGLGSQETVYYGVPTICIPFFADQKVNCDIARNKKFGIQFDLREDQKEYDKVFDEILTNPRYKKAAQELSVLFRDRPMSPREETVYWVEYVIRHGKNVLRSPAVDMEWWQVELLDVYAFIAASVAAALSAAIFVAVKLARLGLSRLRRFSETSAHCSSKKKN